MRTLLALILVTLSFAASATHKQEEKKPPPVWENTEWTYKATGVRFPDWKEGEYDDGVIFTITSSDGDVSLEYSLTLYDNDADPTYAVGKGWKMTMTFNGTLKPKDFASLSVDYSLNDKTHHIAGWKTVGDTVVVPMNTNVINVLHRGVKKSIEHVAEIDIVHQDKDEHEWFWESYHRNTFDFKRGFDVAYHKLESDLL